MTVFGRSARIILALHPPRWANQKLLFSSYNKLAASTEFSAEGQTSSKGAAAASGIRSDNAEENLKALDRCSVPVPPSTYALLLQRCGNGKALAEGRKVHAHIIKSGQNHDRLVANRLVEFYGKCGDVEEARRIFCNIAAPNVFSWTMMITAFAQNGHCRDALSFFRRMDLEGTKPDKVAFLTVLDACATLNALEEGKEIHSIIVSEGLSTDQVLQNSLVNVYGKCGSLDDARNLFDRMEQRTVVSWNAMISAYAQNERGREALGLWKKMHLEGLKPDKISFVTFIDACASLGALNEGKMIHEHIIAQGVESDLIVGNTLVNMYGKCGNVEEARSFFEGMQQRDVVSWNAMMAAYVQHGRGNQALEVFRSMDIEGIQPTRITFVTTLDGCWKLEQGKLLHECIVDTGLELDDVLGKTLINMYSRCGSLEHVRNVFYELVDESSVVLWNAMLAAFSQHGDVSLELFRQMQLQGVKADKFTLISALDACVMLTALEQGKLIHSHVIQKGLEDDMFVQTALVNMYGKCGRLEEARSLFDRMQSRDVVTWNAMLAAYVQQGCVEQALRLFEQMDLEGERPNEVTFARILDACTSTDALAKGKAIHAEIVSSGGLVADASVENALLNMYGKCHSLDDARSLFETMHQRDVVSFNTMMATYAQCSLERESLRLFGQMQQEGVKPDNVTFVSILDACASLAALAQGKATHASITSSGMELDVIVETALVNMYGKCGSLEVASELFETMKNKRDMVSWNVIVAAYAQHGHGKRALGLFRRMQQEGARPDNVSFITVMTACSHSGLLDEAFELFASMSSDHGVVKTATHYGCMIDLLGRSGQLSEAEEFMNKMSSHADPAAWRIFLTACKVQGDAERGAWAAQHVLESEPENVIPYVLLSNIYASENQRWDGAESSRKTMEEKKVMC